VKQTSINYAQRTILAVGLAGALYIFGTWLTSLDTHVPVGWVAYSPLNSQFNGLHPWVRLVIWIVLIVVWVVASLVLFRTKTPDNQTAD
jgi:hypothetical protein